MCENKIQTKSTNTTENNKNKMSEEIDVTLQCALYGTIGIISLFSNALIFLVIGCHKKMRTRSYFLLFNLALTDALIVIIGVPITIANLKSKHAVTNGVYCDIHGALMLLIFCASNFNLALIAVHRYVLIMKNDYYEKFFSKTKTFIAAVFTWVLSGTLFSLPPVLFGWGRMRYDAGRAHCMLDWGSSVSYLIYCQILSFTVPLSIMGFCYYKILKYGHECRKRLKKSADRHNFAKKVTEIRLTIMLIIIVVVFMLCFTPYAVMTWREAVFKKNSPVLSFVAMLFAYSNSMFDFWIYSAMSKNFRRAGVALFFKVCRRKHKVSPVKLPPPSSSKRDEDQDGKKVYVHHK